MRSLEPSARLARQPLTHSTVLEPRPRKRESERTRRDAMVESFLLLRPVWTTRCSVLAAGLVVFLTVSLPATAQPQQTVTAIAQGGATATNQPAHHPSRVLVHFRRGAPRDL